MSSTPPASPSRDLRADVGRRSCRRLHVVLGDQLSDRLSVWDDLDPERDVVLMAELDSEQTGIATHRQRSVLFLAAMRHFALQLIDSGWPVRYVQLDAPGNTGSFVGELRRAVQVLAPEAVSCTRPGDWRVLNELEEACRELDLDLEVARDDHFACSTEEFATWAEGRKRLVMEHFYRWMRKRHDVLLDESGDPEGGRWNFDEENRESFRSAPDVRTPYRPRPDDVVREVVDLVRKRFPDGPGELSESGFHWPFTRERALRALEDFVEHRLPSFGTYQDAMWSGETELHHALLSPALNLKLLDPGELIEAAVAAYRAGEAPLNSVEGFVRQVLGWREFVRGVYWLEGSDYRARNELGATGALPDFYWTGETDLECLREAISPVLERGWAHHIHRLMVQGNFALIAGVEPQRVDDWFLGMFVDGVAWVTTPNVIGMSQHADGGVVGTKPYAASGKYVDRMSNYCKSCPHDVRKRSGEGACPINVLYWDFLDRHRERFESNGRMNFALNALGKLDAEELDRIRDEAAGWRSRLGVDDEGRKARSA